MTTEENAPTPEEPQEVRRSFSEHLDGDPQRRASSSPA